jgi:hypothetical protein
MATLVASNIYGFCGLQSWTVLYLNVLWRPPVSSGDAPPCDQILVLGLSRHLQATLQATLELATGGAHVWMRRVHLVSLLAFLAS